MRRLEASWGGLVGNVEMAAVGWSFGRGHWTERWANARVHLTPWLVRVSSADQERSLVVAIEDGDALTARPSGWLSIEAGEVEMDIRMVDGEDAVRALRVLRGGGAAD